MVDSLPPFVTATGACHERLSTFGVMFAPDHRRAASEMLRVPRPGGRIGMANWTPDGFIGQLFKIIGKYLPPPAGVVSPARWGEEAYLRDLFGRAAEQVHAQRKFFNFRYASAAHWLQVFRDCYGPVHKAFAVLEQDLITLLERSNTAGAQSLVVPAEYLEVIINTRRS